jgi:hypothetical protein
LGRAEAGLERELLERRDIGQAMRGQLRAQARAVDVAEARSDPEAVSTANRVYLDSLNAAGLTPQGAKPVDAVDAFLAGLIRPTPSAGDPPNP